MGSAVIATMLGRLPSAASRGLRHMVSPCRHFRASAARCGNLDPTDRYYNPTEPRKHIIAALVHNEAGVLAGVSNMFAARGYNIDSLVVGRTEVDELSRMTITVIGDDRVVAQVQKQLEDLVPVVVV